MRVLKEKSVSIRLVPADFEKLEAQARRRFSKAASIGSVIVSHQLRRLDHPAIDFHDLPEGGFVARLAGRRVSVWLVAKTSKQCGTVAKTAVALDLPESLVVAALGYAAEYPEEIAADTERGERRLRDEP